MTQDTKRTDRGFFSPWFRPRNLLLLVVLIGVGLAARGIAWAYTAKPEITVDYGAVLEERYFASQPPGEDGRPHLDALIRLVGELDLEFPREERVEPHGHGFNFDLVRRTDGTPEALAELDAAVRWLIDNGLDERFAEAAACTRVDPQMSGRETSLILVRLPELSQYRAVAKARMASLRLARREGRLDDAADGCLHLIRVGDLISRQPFMIHGLVGYSVMSLGQEELRALLFEEDLDMATLERLATALGHITPARLTAAVDNERCSLLDIVQRTYTDDGDGSGHLLIVAAADLEAIWTNDPTSCPRITNLLGLLAADRATFVARANEVYDAMAARSLMTPTARMNDANDPIVMVTNLSWRYHLLHLMTPTIDRAFDQRDIVVWNLELTRIALLLELHRRAHGAWPKSLDELAGDVGTDPVTGKPLLYRVTPQAADGAWYELYSPDPDGSDPGAADATVVVRPTGADGGS